MSDADKAAPGRRVTITLTSDEAERLAWLRKNLDMAGIQASDSEIFGMLIMPAPLCRSARRWPASANRHLLPTHPKSGDIDAIVAMLADDVCLSMPPIPFEYTALRERRAPLVRAVANAP